MDIYDLFINHLREGRAAHLGLSISVLCSRTRILGMKGCPAKIHFEVEDRDAFDGAVQDASAIEKHTSVYMFDPIKDAIEEIKEKRRPGGLFMRDNETAQEFVGSFVIFVDSSAGYAGTSRVEAPGLFETFDAATLEEAELRVKKDLKGRDFSNAFHPAEVADWDLENLNADKSIAVVGDVINRLRKVWNESRTFQA